MTTDGSFGEIPRENFTEAEEKTAGELKKQGKPFLILVNSVKPYKEETQKLTRELAEKYGVSALAANCDQLRGMILSESWSACCTSFPFARWSFTYRSGWNCSRFRIR